MESDESGCGICGILQTSFYKLRITWLNIICNHVVEWSCNNHTFRNLRCHKHNICSHEVFHVFKAKCCLHGDICCAKVLVYIQSIYPHSDTGCCTFHFLKLIYNLTDCHRKSHLPCRFMANKGTRF